MVCRWFGPALRGRRGLVEGGMEVAEKQVEQVFHGGLAGAYWLETSQHLPRESCRCGGRPARAPAGGGFPLRTAMEGFAAATVVMAVTSLWWR